MVILLKFKKENTMPQRGNDVPLMGFDKYY